MSELIDLNSDLGESPEALANGTDLELMRSISSANVACGGHAGDTATMTQTLIAARDLNVAVGAHPSFPDRDNFGRIAMQLSPQEIEKAVREQVLSLTRIADSLGISVIHVKPHGALYHAARSRPIAEAIGLAALTVDPQLVMVGQAGSPTLDHWRAMGLRCAAEAFADRAYEPDGTLRSRSFPGALNDMSRASAQALNIARNHRVETIDGREVKVNAQTICIHSDTPNAPAIAREVRRQLTAAGFTVAPLVL
jgi:5-oxoprolinase (ATP-hydrolysing) subunit A